VFFTDNQGDWVATNKLCHVSEGKFYGWPNRSQPQHITKPVGKPTVWVPYSWARSINGVAYDNHRRQVRAVRGAVLHGGTHVRRRDSPRECRSR